VQFFADDQPGFGFNHVNFKLDGVGETLRLYGTNFALIDSVSFGLQQPGISQGRLPDGGASLLDFDLSTPGRGNYLPLSSVAINEVLTHADPPLEDAIELVNLTAQPVDISGWYLSDSETDLKKFFIPAGTVLPAGGFKVFYGFQFNSTPGVFPSFALDSAHGDSVFLSEASGGNLTGPRTSATFGAAENGISFGRFTNSTGIEFVALSERTFGSDNPASLAQFRGGTGLANSGPKIGPIVISELMYQPTGTGTNLIEQPADEFIELFNNSQSSVALYDVAAPGNRWRISGGVSFTFPAGASMLAQSYLLVVGFDPANDPAASASFRDRYGVSISTPIYGPFSNRLGNQGETIELQKPDAPQTSGADLGFVPYILVDRVSYRPNAPWPLAAAGGGGSLQRGDPADFGNDPLNWKGESPSAGGPRSDTSVAPVIVKQPEDKVVLAGSLFNLKVSANGAEALRYRWQRNNLDLPGQTNELLSLPSAQPPDSGSYRVEVSNPSGVAWSQPAQIIVAFPPTIVTNPISRSVLNGTRVSLSVAVSGTALFSFQWYYNGSILPGANNESLIISSMNANASGVYWVSVSNAVGAIQSESATLSMADLDSDGDGMPDAWEVAHNLNPFDPSDALLDSDGDEMSNLNELIAGTNPQDPQSVLRLAPTGLEPNTGWPRLNFAAMANVGYKIQWTTSFGENWVDLIDIPANPSARMVELMDPTASGAMRFYRVLVVAP
ncbi:MAG: lamin tail domain-containing protein, partial [Verrucomicrobiota bacterium]